MIDPGWDQELLIQALDARGVAPSDVQTVFLTHFHPDHYEAIHFFPDALWCMAGEELSYWRSIGTPVAQFARVFPARSRLAPWIHIVPTPGHTPGHSSVLAATDQGFTVIAGDAVMTSSYFWRGEPFHNSLDWSAATNSIQLLAAVADEIIPGHGAAFSTSAAPADALHEQASAHRTWANSNEPQT
ncbi:MAG: hypothetical protein NVSMB52_10570 [Chloroflexota bacterium]